MLKRRKQVGESDMANAQANEPTRQMSLRLWPGVAIVTPEKSRGSRPG